MDGPVFPYRPPGSGFNLRRELEPGVTPLPNLELCMVRRLAITLRRTPRLPLPPRESLEMPSGPTGMLGTDRTRRASGS